jgi:hypothetical protein
MVGTIKQQLYISGVPKGMTFRVTALNLLPPDPPKEWRAILYTAAGAERVSYLCQIFVKWSIYWSYLHTDHQKAPFTVDPSVNGGHIGEVKMYGAHAFPT